MAEEVNQVIEETVAQVAEVPAEPSLAAPQARRLNAPARTGERALPIDEQLIGAPQDCEGALRAEVADLRARKHACADPDDTRADPGLGSELHGGELPRGFAVSRQTVVEIAAFRGRAAPGDRADGHFNPRQ